MHFLQPSNIKKVDISLDRCKKTRRRSTSTCSRNTTISKFAGKCDLGCGKVSPGLPQSVTWVAAKCDLGCGEIIQFAGRSHSMGGKAEMLHSAKEGYIRTLILLNFEQTDHGGGKSARRHYAGPH